MITLHEHMTAFVNKIEHDGADVDYKKVARGWERMCFIEDREHRTTKRRLRELRAAVRLFFATSFEPCSVSNCDCTSRTLAKLANYKGR